MITTRRLQRNFADGFIAETVEPMYAEYTKLGEGWTERWQFAPVFNGRSVFAATAPTVKRPSRVELAVRPWVRWIPTALVIWLLGGWLRLAAPAPPVTAILRLTGLDLQFELFESVQAALSPRKQPAGC